MPLNEGQAWTWTSHCPLLSGQDMGWQHHLNIVWGQQAGWCPSGITWVGREQAWSQTRHPPLDMDDTQSLAPSLAVLTIQWSSPNVLLWQEGRFYCKLRGPMRHVHVLENEPGSRPFMVTQSHCRLALELAEPPASLDGSWGKLGVRSQALHSPLDARQPDMSGHRLFPEEVKTR